ncbi:hypothetical protein [Ramlibacter sp.]|uniref:hypothetical protein n=1 Tax=Ramlibacter sp. TaxID=1917967 RepID=UPI002D475A2F|nr:hypothetical protein [Ramlibacter sp.]HYD75997.1 hypothetical protein [Ramlibacter sp.]
MHFGERKPQPIDLRGHNPWTVPHADLEMNPDPAARVQALLLAALRSTPRPFRLPPLPQDPAAAVADGAEAAVAFSLEAARRSAESGSPLPGQAQEGFTWGLARLIRTALTPAGGDPAFQALVLRSQDPQVDGYLQLAALSAADRRRVRTAVDAIAHPGKLRQHAPGSAREALQHLHRLASAGEWALLQQEGRQLLATMLPEETAVRAGLDALLRDPALERLLRTQALEATPGVRRYQALCAAGGPLAGSEAALARGRASGRSGRNAEARTAQAFERAAALLDGVAGGRGRCRVVRGLRMPGEFPGQPDRAKAEWDAAIVWEPEPGGSSDILLLAEVKASPAAATTDYGRLLRGLRRLALAEPDANYAFASDGGRIRLAGRSLRQLGPWGDGLPAQVIYCCPAPPGTLAAVLDPASKGMLLAEPASLAFARQLTLGGDPTQGELDPVWAELTHAPRLRAALHQDRTARQAREAMLDPHDLAAALAQVLATTVPPAGASA